MLNLIILSYGNNKKSLICEISASGRAEILLRVSVSHSVSHRIKSGVYISADRFKDGKFSNPWSRKESVKCARCRKIGGNREVPYLAVRG